MRTPDSWIVVLCLGLASSMPMLAQPSVAMPKSSAIDFTGDVRLLPQFPLRATPLRSAKPEFHAPISKTPDPNEPPAAQNATAPIAGLSAPMPAPVTNFAGLNLNDSVSGGQAGAGYPPDTNGDVGPNHYIQAVNDAYAIYDKTSGTRLAAFTENQLWLTGGSNKCNGNSFGDPIVVYDAMADRWILTHFAFSLESNGATQPGIFECIAVSKTGDPVSGGWYLYALQMDPGIAGTPPAGALADYPKFGIWTDCLYMGANVFNAAGTSYLSPLYASFSKTDMYSGQPLTWSMIYPNSSSIFSSFPAHFNAKTPDGRPPAGRPEFFVSESSSVFGFEMRTFTAGPNCGAGGVLSAVTVAAHPSYSFSSTTVPQPGTTQRLDSLTDRIMQRVYYRKVGSAESLWVTNSAKPSGLAFTAHWAQLDVTGGTLPTTIAQRQFFGDATLNRWMGSVAADNQGNMAIGYSTSNGTAPNYPSLAYAGRLAGDPLNTLPQTETVLVAGGGSQTSIERWGDYSSMSLDPVDDCTFWFSSQYQIATGTNWNTRIGSFKFPSCTAPTNGANLTISKTHSGNFAPGQNGATYTLTVTNNGDAPTFGTVTVTDTVPSGLTATGISGSGWTCTQPAGPCTRNDVLNNGSSYPALTLTVNVAANAPSSVQNVATVSGGSDLVYGNNTATDPTTIAISTPTVTAYRVLFGSSSYNLTGSARNRLPWQVTGIQVTFSAPITTANVSSLTGLSVTGLSGLGTNTITFTVTPVSLGLFATSLLGTGPNAIKDNNGTPIATLNQNVKVLHGDFNDDGNVNSVDLTGVNNARILPYNIFADINGNGVVDLTDVTVLRTRIGTSLP